MNFKILEIETGEMKNVDLDWILNEINRDRSGDWQDYNSKDWQEGWNEFCEGDTYILLQESNRKMPLSLTLPLESIFEVAELAKITNNEILKSFVEKFMQDENIKG